MSEAVMTQTRQHKLHYRGRGGQVLIYLGKLLRGFIYQNDWKVMPMAALIAGLVAMVVRKDYFLTMEGTFKGAFALTCVAIWNGCFNSIQVVCRERDIVKREHRSGLHISAYIFSHMVYQALLCLLQTGITLYVCKVSGINFPEKGLFTPWLIVDLGITVFLITYASDMLSLWISCITRSTTTAMTVMPFILIFQLVFSGGIFSLPAWTNYLSALSISNYGFKCITAQSDYNNQPLVTAWNSIMKVENQEIKTTITLGEIVDFLQREDLPPVHDLRATEFVLPSAAGLLSNLESGLNLQMAEVLPDLEALLTLYEEEFGSLALTNDETLSETQLAERKTVTFGQLIDYLAADENFREIRDKSYNLSTTVGEILDLLGREKTETYIKTMTAEANRNPLYENTRSNIVDYWLSIGMFIIVCALLSVIFLEFVDKDKR